MTDSNRASGIFRNATQSTFTFLKETTHLDDLFAKTVPLKSGGYLVPVCELHTRDEDLIRRLSRWREENAFAFPTQFPVTVEGTASWLRERLLDVPTRMLFLVVDEVGTPVGHLGFANGLDVDNELEVDNVVRGERGRSPGIMSEAMEALLAWAQDTFGPSAFYLRVFADNERAVRFYERLGFTEKERIPLWRYDDGATVAFRPEPAGREPDKAFVKMTYVPQRAWDGERMILTAGPSISARETSYALDAVRYGWNHQWSKYITRLEEAFCEYLGRKYAICTSSCTGALHISMLALGVGEGDEVIVPDVTWVASASAAAYTGATPVFADVEPDTWCLDPESVKKLITPRTKAIVPVHLYGHPANMNRIMEIAWEHGLYVVEDAAPSIGAECDGKRTGKFGHCACFSFQGAKVLVTGEGGIFLTDDEELHKRAQSAYDHGKDLDRVFWVRDVGWKYKFSNVQAAIGLGQIERVDELIEMKRRIFAWYEEELAGTPYLTLNREASWARSIYWMSSILLDERAGISRDHLRSELKARNIDTRPVFPAISQYPIWQRPQSPQPNALRIGNQGINLPSGVCLRREQVAYVCRCVREVLAEAIRSDKAAA